MPLTPEQFAQELVGSEERLRQQRDGRREQFFRDSLRGEAGDFQVSGETFHAADVLKALASETYRVARADSDERYLEDLAEMVLTDYPSPIALAFNAFKFGSTRPLTRLGFMRDTWEAIVAVLYSVLLSECAAKNVRLHEALVRDGPKNAPRQIRNADLCCDRISTRLGCIEGVLIYARLSAQPLHAIQVVPVEVVGEMRRLNDTRNEFSHEQTKSDKQADEIIEECEPDLINVLDDVRGLRDIQFCRVHGISHRTPNAIEVERLMGSASTRRIVDLPVQPAAIGTAASLKQSGQLDPVCIHCDGELYVASPHLYCADDESGHQTRVLLLKQVRAQDGKARLEILGQSRTMEFDLDRVQPDLDRLRLLSEC